MTPRTKVQVNLKRLETTSFFGSNQKMTNQKTVLILDDDSPTRIALGRVIQHHGYLVKMFDDPTVFIDSIGPAYASDHCLILDMRMPRLNGHAVQAEIINRHIELPIIYLSGESEVREVISSLKNGAKDFLLKPVDLEELLAAISKALAQPKAKNNTFNGLEMLDTLSQREVEVLNLVRNGMRSQPIANTLQISLRTVKMHRGNIMSKLGVSNMTELLSLFQH